MAKKKRASKTSKGERRSSNKVTLTEVEKILLLGKGRLDAVGHIKVAKR